MPISAWGGARSGFHDLVGFWMIFLLVLLVDWSGLIGLGDGFFELLDFELILEEE
jgi:hypothetical protein